MRFFRFLSDYLLLSACCIFFISTLSPFLAVNYPLFLREGDSPIPILGFTITYWSYMAISSSGTKVFLNNYWFNNNPALANYLGISWVLVAIFLLQVVALASGIFSLLKARKVRVVSFVSSIITVILMIQVYSKVRGTLFFSSFATYQLGYWLTYVSIILFLSALAFSFAS